MTNQQLYESIFHRKSIRKYDMTQLTDDALGKLNDYVSTVKPLDELVKYELVYLKTHEVKNLLPIKAPHYICLYSEAKGHYLMNTGFILQQIDLYLSAIGLGSCWLGMAKPSKQIPRTKNGLDFVIMLAFGNAAEPVHRTETSSFKRKDYANISSIPDADKLLEPVRLAPSASNSQPWFFSGDVNDITISRKKLNLIQAPLLGRLNQVDIGIALCHLWLSLAAQGKTVDFDFQKAGAPEGYEFMAKVSAGDLPDAQPS